MRRLLVPVAVLLFALPLFAGRERPSMSLPLTTAPIQEAFGAQLLPSVATDGENYLVVWEDMRGGSPYADIWGARVSRAGEVLDPIGIPISRIPSQGEYLPVVVWTGSAYLVMYSDPGRRIYGTFVSRDGKVLESGFDVYRIHTNWPDIKPFATNGTMFLLIGGDVTSAIVQLGGDGHATYRNGISYATSAVPTATGFIVFTVQPNFRVDNTMTIYANRFDVNARLLGRSEIPSDGHTSLTASASHDGVILASFAGSSSATSFTLLDGAGNPVRKVFEAANTTAVHIFDAPFGFIATWNDFEAPSQMRAMRFDANGDPIDAQPRVLGPVTGGYATTAVASAGNDFLLTYSGGADGFFSTAAVQGLNDFSAEAFDISRSPAAQVGAKSSTGAGGSVVAWNEMGSSCRGVRAARIGPGGENLDPEGIAVTDCAGAPSVVAVSSTATDHAIAWTQEYTLFARRLSNAGEVLDREPVEVSAGIYNVAAASDDARHTFVWDGWNGESYGIFSRKLDSAGTLTPTVMISMPNPIQYYDRMTLARADGSYILLLSGAIPQCRILCPPQPPPSIEIDRLDDDGAKATAIVRWIFTTDSGPAATFSTSRDLHLVVWNAFDGLRGRRFDAEFIPLDGEEGFMIDAGANRNATVVASNGGWTVSYGRELAGSTVVSVATVAFDGSVTLRSPLSDVRYESDSVVARASSTLIPLSGGSVLAVYEDVPDSGVRRLFVRGIRTSRLRLIH